MTKTKADGGYLYPCTRRRRTRIGPAHLPPSSAIVLLLLLQLLRTDKGVVLAAFRKREQLFSLYLVV